MRTPAHTGTLILGRGEIRRLLAMQPCIDAVDDAFLVFRNADDDAVNILYRRKDGNIGLIEPD